MTGLERAPAGDSGSQAESLGTGGIFEYFRDRPGTTSILGDLAQAEKALPAAADRTGPVSASSDAVSETTLALRYGEADFDRKLTETEGYERIELSGIPNGVGVSHWVDDKGYFFWFKNGNDSGKRHYYDNSAKTLAIGASEQDLTQERTKINEAYRRANGTLPAVAQEAAPPEQQQPEQTTERPPERGGETSDSRLLDGVLEISYNDPNLARRIARTTTYDTIKITDLPENVTVSHWADDNGYFFWFKGNGAKAGRIHYPQNAKAIAVGDHRQDLTLERMKVNEALAEQHGGFQSVGKGTNVVNYLANMSRYGQQALDIQANTLEESVKNSPNPYFKLYLADIYVAQAMKPVIQQVLTTGQANLNNQETLDKLDKAIEMLQSVQKASRDNLGEINRFPPGNIVMPMDPYEVYRPGKGNDGYYRFWGGSLDQARHREVAITMLRSLIKQGALPRFELPPALPPR